MIGILNLAILGGAQQGQITLTQAQDHLALGDRGRIHNVHGIGHNIIAIGTVGGHQGGGRHDLLVVIHGIDHQQNIFHTTCLAIGAFSHLAQQVAHSSGGQVIDGGCILFGEFTINQRNPVSEICTGTHLADHTDGLVLAGAGNDTSLQAVGHTLIEGLTDKAIQPLGTQVQHGLSDGQKSGQLEQSGRNHSETAGQLLDDIIGELAPGSLLIAVCVDEHFHHTSGGDEVDLAQQRMLGPQVLKHPVDNSLGHSDIEVLNGLLGIAGLCGISKLLVVAALLGGELIGATGGQDLRIVVIHHLGDLLLVFVPQILGLKLHHAVEGFFKAGAITVGNGLLHIGAVLLIPLLAGLVCIIGFHRVYSFHLVANKFAKRFLFAGGSGAPACSGCPVRR